MEYITICNLVMDCDNKLLKGGLTNPVACGLRQTEAENGWVGIGKGGGGKEVYPGSGNAYVHLWGGQSSYGLLLSYHPSSVS